MLNKFKLMLAIAMIGLTFAANARTMGGYVANAEDRFVRNVWNFVKEFSGSTSSPTYVGGVPWARTQYLWAEPYMFTSSNNYYVDGVDLAYCSGHGNKYLFQTNKWNGTCVYFPNDLPTNNGWGDYDLEFIIFQSCAVIPSSREVSDWWSPWGRALKGVHQIIGYRTNSYSDNGISNNFARKIKGGGCVWQSWFDAVNEERSWWYGSSYPGYASALWYESTKYDRLYSAEYPDPSGYSGLWNWHQY
jgi:hypothetical protein